MIDASVFENIKTGIEIIGSVMTLAVVPIWRGVHANKRNVDRKFETMGIEMRTGLNSLANELSMLKISLHREFVAKSDAHLYLGEGKDE